MKKIVGINDIIDLNKALKESGLDFKVHLQDACGRQTMRIERLESGGCEDQEEALEKKLRGFFHAKGMEIDFSRDGGNFWIMN